MIGQVDPHRFQGQVGAPRGAAAPNDVRGAALPQDGAQISGGLQLRSMYGQVFPLRNDGQAMTLGRSDANEIRLPYDNVSSRHASVRVVNGRLQICDHGSTNGTTVNGHPLPEKDKWYWVESKGLVAIAGHRLTVEPVPPPAPEQPRPPLAHASPAHVAVAMVGGPTAEVIKLVTRSGQVIHLPTDGSVQSLGRHPQNPIVLNDQWVSGTHGALRVVDGKVQIMDAGSRYGTRVNGHPLPQTNQWYHVADNSTILVGTTLLQVVRETPGQMAAAAVGGAVGKALSVLEHLKRIAASDQLDTKLNYQASMAAATHAMNQTCGLVELAAGVPTLLIPDIHARRDFLVKVMDHEINAEKVVTLLEQGRINVVCMGDGMRSEERGAHRWQQAVREFGNGPQQAIHEEMVESLGTMKMVMDLKNAFPNNFHFLRGRAEDVDGHFFAKYAPAIGESVLIREWMAREMGADFLEQYAAFEKSMPLMVKGRGFVATHTEPDKTVGAREIERRTDYAFEHLGRSDGMKKEKDVRKTLQKVGADPNDRWFTSDRSTNSASHYRLKMEGQLVRLHNPGEFVVALVGADGSFDPRQDIHQLS